MYLRGFANQLPPLNFHHFLEAKVDPSAKEMTKRRINEEILVIARGRGGKRSSSVSSLG